jgi:hypothetical protein
MLNPRSASPPGCESKPAVTRIRLRVIEGAVENLVGNSPRKGDARRLAFGSIDATLALPADDPKVRVGGV